MSGVLKYPLFKCERSQRILAFHDADLTVLESVLVLTVGLYVKVTAICIIVCISVLMYTRILEKIRSIDSYGYIF